MCCRVSWIQLQGTKYVEGSVFVLDISKILPVFGIIINILLNHILFVNYYIPRNFYCYIVKRDKPIPITFCIPNELSDYYTFGLYTLQFFQGTLPTHSYCATVSHMIVLFVKHIIYKLKPGSTSTQQGWVLIVDGSWTLGIRPALQA